MYITIILNFHNNLLPTGTFAVNKPEIIIPSITWALCKHTTTLEYCPTPTTVTSYIVLSLKRPTVDQFEVASDIKIILPYTS